MTSLGEVLRPAGRRVGVGPSIPVYSVTKHRGFVPSLEYFNKQVFGRDLSSYRIVEAGQFAYATIHLDEGSIGIAPERCLVSPMYSVFAVDETRVYPAYLERLLKSPRLLTEFARIGTGTAERRRSISLDALGRLDVQIPPLPEQRRIAQILDHADGLRSKRSHQIAVLEVLIDRAFESRFIGAGFPSRPLSEVADVQGGLTINRARENHARRVPYLRVANVGRGSVLTHDVKEIGVTDAEFERTALQRDDILVVEGHGNVGEVGRVARWMHTRETFVHQNHLIRVRTRTDALLPGYLEAFMNSTVGRAYFRSVAKTTSGLNTINMTDVKNVPIVIPPAEMQADVSQLLAAVRTVLIAQVAHLSKLDELFASLQYRAFRGEL